METTKVTKFTPYQIENLKAGAERYVVWEEGGLGLRITPKGRKTWITTYRHRGKSRMMSHGRYPSISIAKARTLHTKALEDAEKGADPAADLKASRTKERTAVTFGDLADEYINHRDTLGKRSRAEQKRIIDSELLPAWKTWKLRQIERRDVVRLLDGIVDRGAPIMANRTKSLILTLFKFGVDRGHLDDLPFSYLKTPVREDDDRIRKRALTDDEIKTFWHKVDQIDATPAVRGALKLLLLTGVRRGELAKAKKSDVDMESQTWTIPPANSKNGTGYTVPLSDPAAGSMEELIKMAGDSGYVLPSPIGDKPITERALTRALNRSQGLFRFESPFVVHDLRRTVVSGLGRVLDSKGQQISVVVKDHCVNHLRPKMERTYDTHDYADEMREAMTAWGNHVLAIAQGRKPKVISIQKRTG